ncbi:MFS transporter [Schaalia meyeri]|uniref:MFS transporter n=1 Tax=Schaalia meyeri TaxID=52773 RepID=A0AAP9Y862_9ACTO|nr:MFS transporter [Schaalia meyeri]AKU64398.1 MFS transporter [Schaalia meyeri]QQC43398.1 MFS transporter [Schaalia meyeri]SDR89978.1 Predicted arabinose efflux permease, MFS family [Schaalia meyeri]
MSATFASLRYVNYRYWFVATLVASTGTWLQRVAQDWYVLTVLTDHDSSQVGVVTALQFLPIILFSASAGVLADRIPGRRLLQFTQAGIGLVSLVIGVVVLTGIGELWHQYLLAFASGTISAVDTPARQAFVGELVPREKMANAVALNATAFHTARLIGPASAGLFIDWWGVGPVFLIDAGMFAAPVIALALMRTDRLYPRSLVPRARGQLRESLAYVQGRADIRIILALIFVVSALGMNFQMTSALMATTVFGRAAGSFGILSSFMAVGSILGATGAARRAPRLRTIIFGAAFYGACEILLGLSPSYWWFALASIPTGFAMLTMNTSANALVQTRTDPDKRGRVMALYSLVFLGATPIGSPLIGWVGRAMGARWSILVGGIASLSIALLCGAWAAIHWKARVVRRPSFPWVGVEADSSVDAPRRFVDPI